MNAPRLTALDIFKQLNKSNCGKCGLPTCMAFSAMVLQGQKKITDCPDLDQSVIDSFSDAIDEWKVFEETLHIEPTDLIKKVPEIDFQDAAKRTGARLINGSLAVKCLGRDFFIDPKGAMHSECHKNFWVYVPLLNYVLSCKGKPLTGEWVKFDQLSDTMSRTDYVSIKFENELKKMTDKDPGLFFDILSLFGAHSSDESFSADYSLVLYPLPKVPFLFCYWKPDSDFDSKLSVYFDRATEANLDVESLLVLAMGILEMVKKILMKHTHLSV